MIPFFVRQLWLGHTLDAAILLAVSGLTDLLDGFLARRFGWVSQIGKVLDPIADKLTQVTVCAMLAFKLRAYWPFFLILLFKDLVMLVLGGYLLKKGVKLRGARWFGKVGTVFFYISMTLIVLFPELPVLVVYGLLSVTVICALAAALLYIPEFLRYTREAKSS